jgi:hypothetical protein
MDQKTTLDLRSCASRVTVKKIEVVRVFQDLFGQV